MEDNIATDIPSNEELENMTSSSESISESLSASSSSTTPTSIPTSIPNAESDGLPPVNVHNVPVAEVQRMAPPRINLTIAIPTKAYFKGHTVISMLILNDHIRNTNVDMKYDILIGKSNIDQARSMLISKWYDNSKDDDLFMFLDDDQTFHPSDVYRLIQMLFNPLKPCDVACGAYCRSNGTLIVSPEDYVNFINGKDDKLIFGATGFMMIKRQILHTVHAYIKKENPDKQESRFFIDETYSAVIPFFKQRLLSKNTGVAQHDNEWLSEDYSFCYLVRLLGGTIRGFISPSIGHVVPNVAFVDIEKDVQHRNQMYAKAMLQKDPNFKGDLAPIKTMRMQNPNGGNINNESSIGSSSNNINNESSSSTESPSSTESSQSKEMIPSSITSAMTPSSTSSNTPSSITAPNINVMWGNKSIAYITGPSIEKWGPASLFGGLGGSETAVLELTRVWSRLGYDVTVYGNFTQETIDQTYLSRNMEDNINNNMYNITINNNINMYDWKNVRFLPFEMVNVNDIFNIVILWRAPQFADQFKNYKKLLVDMHDIPRPNAILNEYFSNITHYMVKSEFHKALLCQLRKFIKDESELHNYTDDKMNEKIIIIPNGGTERNIFITGDNKEDKDDKDNKEDKDIEDEKDNIEKDIVDKEKDIVDVSIDTSSSPVTSSSVDSSPITSISTSSLVPYSYIKDIKEKCHNKLIYCSSYDRGLLEMLKWGWPIICKGYPDAELHVYYGWDYFDKFMALSDPDGYRRRFKDELIGLINKYDNVFEHGRVGKQELMNIKLHSNIHYYTGGFEEIDCISTRECASVGCVPVVNLCGAFHDKRKDYIIRLQGDPSTQQSHEFYANFIVKLLNDKTSLNKYREMFYNSANLASETWEKIAEEWVSLF